MYTLATRPTRLFGVGHVSCCTRIKLIAGLTRFTGAELVQMIFQKAYSANTKEIQTNWNHSFEFSINASPWSDSFALDYFHSVCITV